MTEEDRRRVIQRKVAQMGRREPRAPVSTGFSVLDAALGVGGIPHGSIVEIFGPPDSRKTTLALQIAALWQRRGLAAGWVDADRTFDPRYAAALGVNIERLPVIRPDSAEQALAMLHQLARSCALDLIVVDSAAALVPGLELETGVGEHSPGLQSRVVAAGLRTLAQVVANGGMIVIFLNQARDDWETSAGGPALKLHAVVRIALTLREGGGVRFRIIKNKAAAAFGAGDLPSEPEPEFAGSP